MSLCSLINLAYEKEQAQEKDFVFGFDGRSGWLVSRSKGSLNKPEVSPETFAQEGLQKSRPLTHEDSIADHMSPSPRIPLAYRRRFWRHCSGTFAWPA